MRHSIENAVRGVGVRWLRSVRTYDLGAMVGTLREALNSKEDGPKVIIASSECQLNRQRRIRPQIRAAINAGKRVAQQKFGVDPDTCTGDHSCIRLSGCPSLTIRDNPDPLREDPIAYVDNDCVGCGHCGEVSHAAILCPSFYRVELIDNPSWAERLWNGVRRTIITSLQKGALRRRKARLA
jgi:indolepyruvate ferredoxin oxidoreductase alpha subunit